MGPGCGCATATGAAGAIGPAVTGAAITAPPGVGTAAITAVGVHTWRWSQGQQQTNGNIKIPMRIVMGPQYCCCVCVLLNVDAVLE